MQGWSVIVQMRSSSLDLQNAHPFVLFENTISLAIIASEITETEMLDVKVHNFQVHANLNHSFSPRTLERAGENS
jgi:hypothetical protein